MRHTIKNVRKENNQIKLMLDPGLLDKGFNIEDIIRELQLEVRAIGLTQLRHK